MDLNDIAMEMAGEYVKVELLEQILPRRICDELHVTVNKDGNTPKPKFYTKLYKQPWFNLNDLRAEDYLAMDSYPFRIDISISDYRISKLSEEDRQLLFSSFEAIEELLLQTYGENASFTLSINKQVQYKNGEKVE